MCVQGSVKKVRNISIDIGTYLYRGKIQRSYRIYIIDRKDKEIGLKSLTVSRLSRGLSYL